MGYHGISELDMKDYKFGMEDEPLTCNVCMDKCVATVSLPCRHASLCVDCLMRLRETAEVPKCPVCRSSIDAYIRWQSVSASDMENGQSAACNTETPADKAGDPVQVTTPCRGVEY